MYSLRRGEGKGGSNTNTNTNTHKMSSNIFFERRGDLKRDEKLTAVAIIYD